MSALEDMDPADWAAQQAQAPRRLPVTYTNVQGQTVGGAAVVSASEQDIRRFGHGGHVCAECRHFEPGHAIAEMARTRWMTQLVKEYGWKIEHAFPGITQERTHEIGLCAAAGDTGTTAFAAACDQFTEARGRLKKEASPEEQGFVVHDMRAAHVSQAERIANWKREQGLDGPGLDVDGGER